jgi:hypothetical protein
MIDDAPLRTAVVLVSSLYLVKHRDVDAALPAGASSAVEMGSACERCRRTHGGRPSLPRSASPRRMLTLMEGLARRVAVRSARPDWTLLAISELASAAIVVSLRSMFSV